MSLSPETVRLQDEWSATLQRTVRDLAKMTNQAAKSYEAYVGAMARVGQLYATCGELMVSAGTPALAMARPVSEAPEARVVTGHVMSSIEHWWRSAEEKAFLAALTATREEWLRWRQETTRTHQHNRARTDVRQLMGEVHSKLELARSKDASSPGVKNLENELRGLQEELAKLDERVQRDMSNNVKLFSRSLSKHGVQLEDVMAASGFNITCCFQTSEALRAAQSRAMRGSVNPSAAAFPLTEGSVSVRQVSNDFSLAPSENSYDAVTQAATVRPPP
ncbi:hypothetical protein ABB37_09486 [Leptomonas pyrrhocoris]|uniref:Uncharacterized protein n=1 Tax=Leptomonas pyrrhocoris TaxID=157538 RepID=A0A0N0DR32_LEPPY|nr:hypothetical protein ABB37_09486 [Leptomonas pyrrhocoris]XP_015652288.1 hypothetical protein ABB37_09486 [Leptomonas pyrrhocoris]KPA73848.1 hypothetical protein ABB37_09486 [Leptomonas pyrrhocoris]KPA73849.1 hypothetical protein ABB37_09486 [Leptomonas pyrrhocoris]|eukprot:XP_015652287.1 hypothetical protein ABB37_09486 [Leptomonas pyrrhocoris]